MYKLQWVMLSITLPPLLEHYHHKAENMKFEAKKVFCLSKFEEQDFLF